MTESYIIDSYSTVETLKDRVEAYEIILII